MAAALNLPKQLLPLRLVRGIDRLESETFDLVVIGGGISGTTIAYEAAVRGLKTALVERSDFASGTTTASTKLIHGGVRYLESYEFGLVREALRERRILLNMAPHVVQSVPFMVPVYRGGGVSRLKLGAAMVLYDFLSYDKNWRIRPDKRMPWRQNLNAPSTLAKEPGLNPEGLKGSVIYYDGQVTSPARLTLEFAKSAAAHGAAIANYAEVRGLRLEAGRVTGAEVRDHRSGKDLLVRGKLMVNAAGLWATQVMKMLGPEAPRRNLAPSKGIHLITRPLLKEHAGVFQTRSGRRLMIIPWLGKSLIGTTDVFYEGDIERVRCTAAEVNALIAEVNEVLPSSKLELSDVLRAYAGCRPLIAKEGVSSLDLSRHWEILDHAAEGHAGLLSVVGGKLTTSRSVAKHVVDRACTELGAGSTSPTRHLAIGGGDLGPLVQAIEHLEGSAHVAPDIASELIHAYGSAAPEVAAGANGTLERIRPDLPFVRSQIRYAVEAEMAFSVVDVALRRTDLGNVGDTGLKGGRVIAQEMQPLLGWSDEQRAAELKKYQDELAID